MGGKGNGRSKGSGRIGGRWMRRERTGGGRMIRWKGSRRRERGGKEGGRREGRRDRRRRGGGKEGGF